MSRLRQWIQDHLTYPHEGCCLIWPFARHMTGYGTIGVDGKNTYAHRYMCRLVHGEPPTPQHHAAHSCGRGPDGCVNPHHLSWKTNSENQMERRPNPLRRKMTPEQVHEIRSLKDVERVAQTAERFGITENNVRQIQSGKTWRIDRRDIRHFSDDEVRSVRRAVGRGAIARLSREMGVPHSTLSNIRRGRTYRHVPDEPIGFTTSGQSKERNNEA